MHAFNEHFIQKHRLMRLSGGWVHRPLPRGVLPGYLFLLVACSLLLAFSGCNLLHATTGPQKHLMVQQAPRARLTYVAMGASDTFGIGTDDPQTQSWPYDLSSRLGSGVHLVNLGIPDVHLHDALGTELPVALDSHPNLVTIWLAVNDLADGVSVESYSHDLDLLLARLQTGAPHALIAVANVPDVTLLPHFHSYDQQLLREQISVYNSAIATVVEHHHVLLVDLHARWNELASHPEYISDDGFHPNAIGATRLAEIFYTVVQSRV